MFLRFTNATLLFLVALLTLTGVYGLVWPMPAWMFDVHRAGGWALIALLPSKIAISLRSLRRGLAPRFDRGLMVGVAVLLSAGTLAVLALGLMWAWRVGPDTLSFQSYQDTAISWHWMLALGLLPPFALHAWRRWPRPKRSDFLSRRSALRLLALGAAGVAGWRAAEGLALARSDASRRFTGSREQASFSGNDFPVTNGPGDGRILVDASVWRLTLGGAVETPRALTYAEVLALPAAKRAATIDCTTGWYSTQVWRGVSLAALLARTGLEPAAAAVRLRAASGYAVVFSLPEAREILLATHVGGEMLDHHHGFPLRAVVPSRRGWFWVKWMTGIEVLTRETGVG